MTQNSNVRDLTPVIVDVGSEKKRRIKDLKKGRGPLMDEIRSIVDEVREAHADIAEGRDLLPVVLVYRKKRKRSLGIPLPLPLPFGFDDDDEDDD